MNDLISRSELIKMLRFKRRAVYGSGSMDDIARVIEDVEKFPAAKVGKTQKDKPVRHGRWDIRVEVHGDLCDDGLWEEIIAQCSECGREVYLDTYECAIGNVRKELAEYPYCHCGTKMDGDEDAAD